MYPIYGPCWDVLSLMQLHHNPLLVLKLWRCKVMDLKRVNFAAWWNFLGTVVLPNEFPVKIYKSKPDY